MNVGDIATYRASLDLKGSQVTPTFRWTVSVGEIVSGQGTNTIEVRQPNACLTATVEVDGFPESCPLVASETSCGDPAPEAVKIGEMSNTSPPDLEAVRRFRDELRANPNNQGFIFLAYPPNLPKAKLAARENVIRDLLTKERLMSDYGGSRITLVQVTSKRDITEFWRIPPGASNPKCEACELTEPDLPATGDLVMADEFGKLPIKDELGRLDLIAADWLRNPSFYVYFYLSSDPKDSLSSEQAREKRIRNHLTVKRKVPTRHVVILKGDSGRRSTQIYIVPADARQNMPSGRSLDILNN